jgi:hypothetical protein
MILFLKDLKDFFGEDGKSKKEKKLHKLDWRENWVNGLVGLVAKRCCREGEEKFPWTLSLSMLNVEVTALTAYGSKSKNPCFGSGGQFLYE